MAKIAIVEIEGVANYCQSRHHATPKLPKELADDYEQRTWREKMHFVKETGVVFIPPLAFKNCIAEAAKFLSMQVPGKGKATYTKHFEAGVLVHTASPLQVKKEVDGEIVFAPILKDEVVGQPLFVPADGVRGSGKRVMKVFPTVPEGWRATVKFIIFDDTITKEVFLTHLNHAGNLIGIGTFRVRNNGICGRFEVLSLDWQEVSENERAVA